MLTAAISAIGLQIAIYYGLAGLAVVLAYRKILFRSAGNLIFIGVWPLVGSIFMFWIFYEALGGLDTTAKVVGLGALAIGLVPMIWFWAQGVGLLPHPAAGGLPRPARLRADAGEAHRGRAPATDGRWSPRASSGTTSSQDAHDAVEPV